MCYNPKDSMCVRLVIQKGTQLSLPIERGCTVSAMSAKHPLTSTGRAPGCLEVLLKPTIRGGSPVPNFPSIRVFSNATKPLQSCPTLCDPVDCSPPGSPVPGILQARTLEWVAISFSQCPLCSPLSLSFLSTHSMLSISL